MFALNRLQLLACAYFVVVLVSGAEFVRDISITHNFLQTWLNSFTNPVNLAMLPICAIIGWLYTKELIDG